MTDMRKKIQLVPASAEHAEAWHSWRKQSDARRFMPMVQVPVEDLRTRLNACSHDLCNRDLPEYRWIIVYDNVPVGTVALTKMSSVHQHAEISYHLDSTYHNMGIGSAAVAELIDRVYAQTELHRLYATISKGNIASCRLVESLEFKRDGCLREHFFIEGVYVDQLVFSLLRSEWLSTRAGT
ncbi:MAG: GNAT family N-acetyltransferase [Arenicellales bacterium]